MVVQAETARRAPRSEVSPYKPEGALDLVPDDDAQVDARRDEDEEHHPETKLGALRLPLTVPVVAAPGSMQPVRALNRDRIELQRLIDHLRAASRLGHPGEHKARGGLSLLETVGGVLLKSRMDGISEQGLETLAAAGRRAAGENGLDEALDALGEAAAGRDRRGRGGHQGGRRGRMLGVRRVISRSEALAAELAGSSFSVARAS